MRPITLGSLRYIVGCGLLSGCYSPWMSPQQGYGSPMYGNQYQGGYGGYQGIQTLTPGQYYAPGTTVPGTYAPRGLQPTPDENSSGSGSGNTGNGTGNGTGGGDAPIYNPQGSEPPTRPVPTYDGDAPGSDLEEPQSDAPVRENNSGEGFPGAMSEPVPNNEWGSEPTIEQVRAEAPEADAVEETTETSKVAEPATTETTEEHVPPLLGTP